uniref:Uncharacterized protein n=1 Tax=Corethron hystrix TaxID=216773 RepID=A0A7S1BEY9_9STRA|mmetsp:Transcript_22626/g.51853  ORF Transcript_22626/g.51853 Transcript_22626/m.51853 type:complete len:594 (+) Transcript_22626:36-1817(+)|eukprot:CAMPEP_0113307226 /NCGR_PEP_ID=MMETSP0010_2-20120614/6157_1 /TAXON_ID=216773 ORGANISM="Corethron hystrix, Strain 308" /NCGR_SAMPLE_ID=MMETSP0010_2 /ASSEMBLY_ACC=CAM_ASM_000155 /LENGTH=593 /DNA_ID=CAMNT_0000162041 /DNA_START=8 /DNA_END=1789 /DNA_ORIENTATION=- /assembly_acc=CAM_ASM_000155
MPPIHQSEEVMGSNVVADTYQLRSKGPNNEASLMNLSCATTENLSKDTRIDYAPPFSDSVLSGGGREDERSEKDNENENENAKDCDDYRDGDKDKDEKCKISDNDDDQVEDQKKKKDNAFDWILSEYTVVFITILAWIICQPPEAAVWKFRTTAIAYVSSLVPASRPATPPDAPPIYTITPFFDNNAPLFNKTVLSNFLSDGVIAVRGLISSEALDALDEAADAIVYEKVDKETYFKRFLNMGRRRLHGKQFYVSRTMTIFPPAEEGERDVSAGFRNVALRSLVPRAVAELLAAEGRSRPPAEGEDFNDSSKGPAASSSDEDSAIRLLRDIFLAKDGDTYICGWHVDDTGYWPSAPDFPGINAWIALDDMPSAYGGGFALSVGSHKAEWAPAAHRATGSTRTFPVNGWKDAEDMFRNRQGGGTCNINTTSPTLHAKLESRKRVYEIKRGDVILHTRWLFHRTIPFKPRGLQAATKSRVPPLYRRYSVRYVPGTTVLPKGFGTEMSILLDPDVGGKTLNDACASGGPWYPRVWPAVDKNELIALEKHSQTKIREGRGKLAEVQAEMRPFLEALALKNKAKQAKKAGVGRGRNRK